MNVMLLAEQQKGTPKKTKQKTVGEHGGTGLKYEGKVK